MYNLGLAMKEYQKFFWTGILLFFLIIPPIILFVKYVKYIIALNEVKTASPDQNLQKGFTLLIVGLLLNFTVSFAFENWAVSFTGLIGVVLNYIAYQSLELSCKYHLGSKNISVLLFSHYFLDPRTTSELLQQLFKAKIYKLQVNLLT